MRRYRNAVAASRGVGIALLKRGVFVMLGIVVFQLFSLQWTVSSGGDRQQIEANQRLERALKENKAEHAKTQEFVRCLIGIVLLPLDRRPEDPQQALSTCGSVPDSVSSSGSPQAKLKPSSDTARTLQPTTSSPPDNSPAEEPADTEPTQQPVSPLVQPLLNIIEGLGL